MVFHSQQPLQPINKAQRSLFVPCWWVGHLTLSATTQSTPVGVGDGARRHRFISSNWKKKELCYGHSNRRHKLLCLSSHPGSLTDKTVVRCLNKQSILSQTIDFSFAIKLAGCVSQYRSCLDVCTHPWNLAWQINSSKDKPTLRMACHLSVQGKKVSKIAIRKRIFRRTTSQDVQWRINLNLFSWNKPKELRRAGRAETKWNRAPSQKPLLPREWLLQYGVELIPLSPTSSISVPGQVSGVRLRVSWKVLHLIPLPTSLVVPDTPLFPFRSDIESTPLNPHNYVWYPQHKHNIQELAPLPKGPLRPEMFLPDWM